jgi:hypothetical protein
MASNMIWLAAMPFFLAVVGLYDCNPNKQESLGGSRLSPA